MAAHQQQAQLISRQMAETPRGPTPRPHSPPAADVTNLPQLPGSGAIYSIAYKASNDAGFKTAWTALTDGTQNYSRHQMFGRFSELQKPYERNAA